MLDTIYNKSKIYKHLLFHFLLLTQFAVVAVVSIDECKSKVVHIDTTYLWTNSKKSNSKRVAMYVFRPEHPNGVGVVICPGGSYFWLAKETEGIEVAEWLSNYGITSFVLFYRTAGFNTYFWHSRKMIRGVRYPDMLMDAQKSLQIIHENANQYNIDRDKIGMVGFSAGGHLVLLTACSKNILGNSEQLSGGVSFLRPSFVAAIYPVVTLKDPYAHKKSRRGILGDDRQHDVSLIDSLSIERHIPSNCPPIFLVNCVDDPVVDYRNSEILDSALTKSNVPHKYIQYQKGKHGFGVRENKQTIDCSKWKEEFVVWLNNIYGK